MLRKITRIFYRSLGILFLLLLFVFLVLFFAAQTYTFQTWLGSRASTWLSNELKTNVHVDRVELEFFKKASLEGVFLLDKHADTIIHGDIVADISNFNLRARTLNLDRIVLRNITSKLIKYKGEDDFNYQFLIDYFDSGKKDTTARQEWTMKFGDLLLENVSFLYRHEKRMRAVNTNIDFDNIWLHHTWGKISDFRQEKDTFAATISGLRTVEQSGFKLSELTTRARISSKRLLCRGLVLKTPRTDIKGLIDFSYDQWGDYQDFVEKVRMNSYLDDSSYVHLKDIAAFAKELNGLDETVDIAGRVVGTVSDMSLRNMRVRLGNYSRFYGNLTLTGLPEIEKTFMKCEAVQLATNYLDVYRIPVYPFSEGKKMDLPPAFKKLGTIRYKGIFSGYISNLKCNGVFSTGLGLVSADAELKLGKKAEDMTYSGKVGTTTFDLGTLLGQEDFNDLSMSAVIKGKGTTLETLDADFEGLITNIVYRGYNYQDIRLNGTIEKNLFNGMVVSKDKNADFDFNGTVNFQDKVPQMDFISTINKLNLKELHFTNKSDSGVLSSQILINVRGSNIDNLTGLINFDNTIYKTRSRTFKLSTFNIQMEQSVEEKKIRMNSEYLNATAFGQFRWQNLEPAFQAFLYHYYPTFFQKPASQKKFTDDLSFYVRVKKYKTINELFTPDLMIASNSIIEGNFNAEDKKLNIQVNSPNIKYKKVSANELVVILNENNNTVIAEASGRALNLSDSLSLDNFNVAANSVDNTSSYSADWDNLKRPSNKGEIKGRVKFEKSMFNILNEKLSLTLNDSNWIQQAPASMSYEKAGGFKVNPITISNHQQSILISGALSTRKEDSLVVNTNSVILQQFNPLLGLFRLKLEGTMNGRISLSNSDNNFAFNGDLGMRQLKINDNTIGELQVNTTYHTSEKYISLNGYTSLGVRDENGEAAKNISFKGTYDLEKKEESIDINFSAKPANLSLLNPFLTGILTIKSGFVNGSGKIHGTPSNIMIDGKFRLFNSEIKVDYTNVTYNITGDIEVMPDQIRFSDLLMREKGTKSAPQGTINGNIFHSNFSKLQIDYDITYNNMLVLNTTERENKTFYGKIYGTGNVGIWGFVNSLNMKIDATTKKHSRFYLPLDGPAEIGESDFIHFVKRDTTSNTGDKPLTGFNIDMVVHATPDAQVQIIIDKTSGDMLNVQGQGDLTLRVNTLGKFDMVGDYIITDGDYLFTLENVINKKFEIEAGSSISWSGNPLNAEIDVTTNYRQRTSLAPLLGDTNSNSMYKGRSPVDCKLMLHGKLFNPNISFAIDFPNIRADDKAKINNVLSDDAELNRQVFSFLLFRSFVTPLIYNTNAGGVTAGGAAASTGSELLSNRVSEFLNSYFGTLTGIRDLQLGLNYRPGTQTTGEAVDLALSKQFLDNRVTVDGNFGVNNNATTTNNSNSLIGDVNVDYKLSQDGRFRLKGFNRTNDNAQISTMGGQYTQGVGFFYRVEFNRVEDLFEQFKARLRRKEAAQKSQ
jgi:hypothetical protein